jgi:hypothetical protein
MLVNNKFIFVIFSVLLTLIGLKTAMAVKTAPPILGNYARQLLDVQHWDEMYESERQKDVNYLLGSIDEKSLPNLNEQQKDQVVSMMRSMAITQLLKDKSYFKGYLIEQYTHAFTQDEFMKLIDYFKTDLMQTMIKAKIDHQEIKIEELNFKLTSQTPPDKKITDWFNGSYLNARYARFQEDITPKLNTMIYERSKQVLTAVFNEIPVLVKSVS